MFVHLLNKCVLPFVSSNSLFDQPFNLMHCDIWGSFTPQTVEWHHYFFAIVDDGTRFTWIYFLKQKFNVLSIFPDFYTLINTQLSAKIKSVRAANALELAFTDFFFSFQRHSFLCGHTTTKLYGRTQTLTFVKRC